MNTPGWHAAVAAAFAELEQSAVRAGAAIRRLNWKWIAGDDEFPRRDGDN